MCIAIIIVVVSVSATELYIAVGRMNLLLAANAALKAEMAAMEARLTAQLAAIEKLPLWWQMEARK